jgi:tetratricopeptide (TPR) repeat protein
MPVPRYMSCLRGNKRAGQWPSQAHFTFTGAAARGQADPFRFTCARQTLYTDSMRLRFSLLVAFCVSCAALALAGNVSNAENELRGSPPIVPDMPLPKQDKPENARKGEQAGPLLQNLFRELNAAPNVETAKSVEQAIWGLWLKSGSDTADLLMNWAVEAIAEKNYDRALEYLDAIVEVRPNYAEGWNKRATVYYMRDDYGRSLGDLQHVLALEPRHFGALAGLGTILQEIDEKPRALEAFRRALAIHPHFESAKKAIDRLIVEVEGRDI